MEFPKICWTVKYICSLPSACRLKKNHKTEFDRRRKHEIANSGETTLETPVFFGF